MSKSINIDLRWEGKSKRVAVGRERVSIGRSPSSDLVLPFPWVREHHLLVKYDAGAFSAKLADAGARARVNLRALTDQWEMIAEGTEIHVPTPWGRSLTLKLTAGPRAAHNEVLEKKEMQHSPGEHSFAMEIASESPLDEPVISDKGIENPPVSQADSVAAPQRRKSDSTRLILMSLISMTLLVGGALTWSIMLKAKRSAALTADYHAVDQAIAQARELIKDHKYIQAKHTLDTAARIAASHPQFSWFTGEIATMSAKEEIKWGGIGYIQMDGLWLPPEKAAAWKKVREHDDPQIQEMLTRAGAALVRGDLQSGEKLSDDVLAIMDAEPVTPHPRRSEAARLRTQIYNRIVYAEMTAKGLVLYNDHWVTPQEKFCQEQLAKGLAEYKGKWLPKEQAFAAEQVDKGLVLYNGKWMTVDQKMTAEGYVRFEDKWLTVAQRDATLAQRAKERAEADARAEAQRQEMLRQAEARREEAQRIEKLKPDAYTMSQQFVKDLLKSPSSAKFEDYSDSHVTVVYTDGWYFVQAPVDAMNSFGVMLRQNYVCKLRPVSNTDKWEQDGCYIVDK